MPTTDSAMHFGLIALTIGGILAVCAILYAILRNIAEWSINNRETPLTVSAKVVSHRSDDVVDNANPRYFITFQLANGARLEFAVSAKEYHQLKQGVHGKLSFQGTRYNGFRPQ